MMNYCNLKSKYASIGVVDSGIGGITVLSQLLSLLPNENYIYLADKGGAPYGEKSSQYILLRTMKNCHMLLKRGVKAIVVACNTATNVGIKELRQSCLSLSNCIYVGLEPAVKPAMQSITNGNVLVLLTPATAKQDKFVKLVDSLDKERIIISPQPRLASLIEDNIDCLERIQNYVIDIVLKHQNVESIVLGCTHYVFLKGILSKAFGNRIRIYDGNLGATNRLISLLLEQNLLNDNKGGSVEFIVT